jgi:hypothetical protein
VILYRERGALVPRVFTCVNASSRKGLSQIACPPMSQILPTIGLLLIRRKFIILLCSESILHKGLLYVLSGLMIPTSSKILCQGPGLVEVISGTS